MRRARIGLLLPLFALLLPGQGKSQAPFGPCPSQQAFMALAEATGLREACDRAAPERKDATARTFQPLASAAGACHEFLGAPGQHRILIGSASSMMEAHVRKDPERLCGADLQAGVARALPLFSK